MPKKVVSMSVEENAQESLCEVVSCIHCSVYLFKVDQVLFDPVILSKVLDIDMLSATCWFLCIAHFSATVVIFICNSSGFLWYVKVPEYAAHEEAHLSNITGYREFSLG